MARRLEVLILDGCPNGPETVERAHNAISEVATDTELHLIVVQTVEEARNLLFLGSPSVRIDGLDVEVSARGRSDFGLQCRVYAVSDRVVATPPMEWIAEALRAPLTVEDGH
jgi:hypothetical protein